MVPSNNKSKKRGVRISRPRSVSRSAVRPAPVPSSRGSASRQPTQMGQLIRTAGGGIGAAIGGAFGMPALGSALGGLGGAIVSKLTGNGDYTVKSNTVLGIDGHVPEFAKSGRVRIHDRECVAEISTTTAFTVRQWEVNPGLALSFPKLAALASKFETFKIHGMVFTFVSTSATAVGSTNTALGSIIMATEYQVGRSNPSNLAEILAMKYVNQAAPSVTQVHGIECDGSENIVQKYIVRAGGVPSGQDMHLFDPCRFLIATQGAQAASVAGQLFVSYDIEFYNPNLTNSTNMQMYQVNHTLNATDFFAVNNPTYDIATASGPQYATASGHGITFNIIGEYFVEMFGYSSDVVSGWTSGFNSAGSTVTYTEGNAFYGPGGSSTKLLKHFWVKCTAVGQVLAFSSGASASGLPGWARIQIAPEAYSEVPPATVV